MTHQRGPHDPRLDGLPMTDDEFERAWRNPNGGYGVVPGRPDEPGLSLDELRRARTEHANGCECWRHRIVRIHDGGAKVRARTCEHLAACVNEDGTAIDGGTFMPCDMAPCDECGALCPGSNWTPERAMRALDREYLDLSQKSHRTEETIRRYLVWDESRAPRCHICRRVMSDDPNSGDALNCGGDCAGCMREVERGAE